MFFLSTLSTKSNGFGDFSKTSYIPSGNKIRKIGFILSCCLVFFRQFFINFTTLNIKIFKGSEVFVLEMSASVFVKGVERS